LEILNVTKFLKTNKPMFMLAPGLYNHMRDAPMEQALFLVMKSILPEGCKNRRALFLDGGANDGFWAMEASSIGCRVITFEPQAHCVRKLAFGIALNKFYPLVDLRNFGISPVATSFDVLDDECDGSAAYEGSSQKDYKMKSPAYADSMKQRKPAKNRILTQKIDDVVCPEDDVILWHIDVEGLELGVLQSGMKLLESGRVQNIFVEWSPGRWDPKYYPSGLGNEIFEKLLKLGYFAYTTNYFKNVSRPSETIRFLPDLSKDSGGDLLFTKDPNLVNNLKSLQDYD